MAFWAMVAGLGVREWYHGGGVHHCNRLIIAAITLLGAQLIGVPLTFSLMMAVGIWFWATVPFEWPRPGIAAGVVFGTGIICWAVGISLI